MKLTTPYNFVPLSNKIYPVEWASLISQDVPFDDGEDGTIEIEISNITPLFVRDGDGTTDDKGYDYSAHIMQNGRRRYFIPGTSLKGCFRSVLEIISFSHVSKSEYNNDFFGYREMDTKKSTYTKEVKGVSCGWLICKELARGKNEYYITECRQGLQKITHKKIKEIFPQFNIGEDHKTAEIKQRSIQDSTGLFPLIHVEYGDVVYSENKNKKTVPEGDYRVVCTGFMNGKKVEYLFSNNENEEVKIDEETINKFFSVHKTTPYFAGQNGKGGFLKERLENGKRIPVFFMKEHGVIRKIGVAAMLKLPFMYSVQDAVNNAQGTFNGIDMATALFGYINEDEKEALKGRIQISSAFMSPDVNITDELCKPVSAVLGQPHPSFYPLYLQQKGSNGELVRYSTEGLKIGGRKRYRIIKGNTAITPNASDKEKVKSNFRPLPDGNVFRAKINVHNLRKIEIGALLSAITFNLTPGTFHGIGMAKNLGYGKCTCKITNTKGLKYNVEDYIRAFNLEMSCFLQDKFNSRLDKEESLSKLVSIASDTHTAEDMKQLELGEFDDFKKPANFTPLEEKSVKFNVLINEDEAYAAKISTEVKKMDVTIDAENYDLAKQMLYDLKMQCIRKRIPTDEIEAKLKVVEELIKKKESVTPTATPTVIAEQPAENPYKGKSLKESLESSPYTETVLKKWVKVNTFDEDEYNVLRDIISAKDKKQLKKLKKNDISKAIGEEYFNRLKAELNL